MNIKITLDIVEPMRDGFLVSCSDLIESTFNLVECVESRLRAFFPNDKRKRSKTNLNPKLRFFQFPFPINWQLTLPCEAFEIIE